MTESTGRSARYNFCSFALSREILQHLNEKCACRNPGFEVAGERKGRKRKNKLCLKYKASIQSLKVSI